MSFLHRASRSPLQAAQADEVMNGAHVVDICKLRNITSSPAASSSSPRPQCFSASPMSMRLRRLAKSLRSSCVAAVTPAAAAPAGLLLVLPARELGEDVRGGGGHDEGVRGDLTALAAARPDAQVAELRVASAEVVNAREQRGSVPLALCRGDAGGGGGGSAGLALPPARLARLASLAA